MVFDEVKVKEGIVYDKHDYKSIGFVDVGDVNNALLDYERSINGENGRMVAKYMLVFMVRGIFIKLNFPYAQYILHIRCSTPHQDHEQLLGELLWSQLQTSFVGMYTNMHVHAPLH